MGQGGRTGRKGGWVLDQNEGITVRKGSSSKAKAKGQSGVTCPHIRVLDKAGNTELPAEYSRKMHDLGWYQGEGGGV